MWPVAPGAAGLLLVDLGHGEAPVFGVPLQVAELHLDVLLLGRDAGVDRDSFGHIQGGVGEMIMNEVTIKLRKNILTSSGFIVAFLCRARTGRGSAHGLYPKTLLKK